MSVCQITLLYGHTIPPIQVMARNNIQIMHYCTEKKLCKTQRKKILQQEEIVFNTVKHRSETVQISSYFHSKQCQLCEGPNNVSREK